MVEELLCFGLVQDGVGHAALSLGLVQLHERALKCLAFGRERQLSREAAERRRRAPAAGIVTIDVKVGERLVVMLPRQCLPYIVNYTRDDLCLAGARYVATAMQSAT